LKRRSHQSFIYRRENPDFPLRRFIRHGSGKRLTGAWSQGRNEKYPYYRFIGISKAHYKRSNFEEQYINFINRYTMRPEYVQYFKTALKSTLDLSTQEEFKESEKMRLYEKELSDRQTSLINKNQKGIISDAILRRQLEQIEGEMIKLQAKLYSLPDKTEDIGKLMEFAAQYLIAPGKVWAEASYKQRIELQWFEFPQGVIFQKGEFQTTKIASIFKVKDVFLPSSSPNVRDRGFEPLTLPTSRGCSTN
jgi:site-specific DNA recombinase